MPWIIATTLTVFVPLALVYFYISRRVIASVLTIKNWNSRRIRQVVLGIILYINLYPILFLVAFLIGGRTRIPAFSGESFVVDLLFAYPFWFGLVIAVQLFLVLVVLDGVRLALRISAPAHRDRWKRFHSYGVLLAIALISVYSVFIIVKDTWTVRINERNLQVNEKATALAGTKIVIVSDVQGDGRTNSRILEEYVERINQQDADLVVFAGDLVTSGEGYIESTAQILGSVRSRFGNYAAVGDHDMFSNKEYVIREMRQAGFVIADDTTISIPVKGTSVAITLVTRTYLQTPKNERLEEITADSSSEFRIFLVHQPAANLVDFASERGYDLFAAGHTHGGGIAFGIPGLYTFAPANLESKYVSGFYEVGRMLVVVTNGIGMTLAPIRFHAPSEITVVTLTR